MKQLTAHFCALVGSLIFVAPAFAQRDAQFAKANQEYAAGHFKEAINGYEALIGAGEWSANLFYDLGNAYFRSGDFGHAILNYQRALALEPHHPEAQANLPIARDEARALELRPTWPERYLRFATINQYALAATVAFWVAAFCITALILRRQKSAALATLSVLSLALFVSLVAAIFWVDIAGGKNRALAIVTGKDAEARVATADNANRVLVLPPGSEIKILKQRGDWLYAALPNNLNGWIPAKSAELVRL
jgi:tetratricopeptide (TPR) repeat protein